MNTVAPVSRIVNPAPVLRTLSDAEFRAYQLAEVAKLDAAGWPADEHRPSPAPYVPTATDEAFYRGFTLALDGEDPAIPTDESGRLARSFHAGVVAGKYTLDRDYRRWLDSLELPEHDAVDPYDNLSDAEIIEMNGARPVAGYDQP